MNRLAIVQSYSGAHAGTPVPASLELLFRLAGIHVFLILGFSGSIKHLKKPFLCRSYPL